MKAVVTVYQTIRNACFFGLEVREMSKWILIEVENQNINEPDTYDSYIEAYDEMKSRYENLVEEGDEASIDEYDANIQTDSYNIDWKIYEVEAE